jgi:hypothetical protein
MEREANYLTLGPRYLGHVIVSSGVGAARKRPAGNGPVRARGDGRWDHQWW